ncbi:hypothetical protein ROHU_018702 [Labeo rohita]|uniref:Uncharacterized protein n=1 Tax=Labeo rohita TaxID=84645 RepID=A0A498N9J4_LABRO|nr:hypothetical protein ROHU_018702 [Labeo rohita]
MRYCPSPHHSLINGWTQLHFGTAVPLDQEKSWLFLEFRKAAASDKSGNFPSNNDISRKRSRSARTPSPAWHTKGPGMSCKGLNWNQAFQWEADEAPCPLRSGHLGTGCGNQSQPSLAGARRNPLKLFDMLIRTEREKVQPHVLVVTWACGGLSVS